MTEPEAPFEEKLASPEGTERTPRTSTSFLGRSVCGLTVVAANKRATTGISNLVDACITLRSLESMVLLLRLYSLSSVARPVNIDSITLTKNFCPQSTKKDSGWPRSRVTAVKQVEGMPKKCDFSVQTLRSLCLCGCFS